MQVTHDLKMLVALIAAGALVLLAYVDIAFTMFRAPELSKRARWVGLVIPGAALALALQTGRVKRVVLFALLLAGYVALRVAAP